MIISRQLSSSEVETVLNVRTKDVIKEKFAMLYQFQHIVSTFHFTIVQPLRVDMSIPKFCLNTTLVIISDC